VNRRVVCYVFTLGEMFLQRALRRDSTISRGRKAMVEPALTEAFRPRLERKLRNSAISWPLAAPECNLEEFLFR
jgi:hypothetical protein